MEVFGENGKRMLYYVGAKFENKKGEKYTILERKDGGGVVVEFEDGAIVNTYTTNVRLGTVRNPNTTALNGKPLSIFVGDRFTNTHGSVCEVVEYVNSFDISVKFDVTGYETKINSGMLLGGGFRDPYHPTRFGVGYVGTKYQATGTRQHTIWSAMLGRCYSEGDRERDKSYLGCTVEEFLHSYENFYEFVTPDKGFQLGYEMDKDPIARGNREYSRDTITFIPKIINVAIQGMRSGSKDGLPAGVFYRKDSNKYRAISCEYGKLVHCGQSDDPMEVFQLFKRSKEGYFKRLAEEYKSTISPLAYEALMEYDVRPYG